MEDKVALITGSSKGIGRNIALKLAGVVSGIAIHYMNNEKSARKVQAEIEKKGNSCESFKANLKIEEEAVSLIKNLVRRLGRLDILVNNYGPILVKPWEKIKSLEWNDILLSNLNSSLFCTRAALPEMRKRKWGRIINIGYSRVEHLVAFPTITPYAIAKTGLLILTRTVAKTEALSGITANMVSPGIIEGGVLPRKTVPEEKIGEYKDVSEAVSFLASDKADFITGANLIVAGGWKV
ncbi:MAG: SDR family oxidoreductase [Candidatus Aminicenantaceae bacterium]